MPDWGDVAGTVTGGALGAAAGSVLGPMGIIPGGITGGIIGGPRPGMPGGGKGEVAAPQMSPEERAYLGEIQSMIKEQRDFNTKMMPVYAHQMHYKIVGDEWQPMSDEEWLSDPRTTGSQREQWQIASLARRRYKQALEGNIPLTEQMKQQKQSEWDQLKASAGLVGETSDKASADDTIGVQKLKAFRQRWNLLEEAQRHGELGAGLQRMAGTAGLAQQGAQGTIGGLQGIGASNQPSIQNYASLLQPYQAYNQMGMQAQAATAANQASMLGSIFGLGGQLGAAGITASDRDAKKNIKKKGPKDEQVALREIRDTPSYEYQYKDRMGLGPQRHIGTMAEESPDAYAVPESQLIGQGATEEDFYDFEEYIRQKYPGEAAPPITEEDFYEFEAQYKYGNPGKKVAVNLGDKVEHTNMGLKALAREVEKLKRRK